MTPDLDPIHDGMYVEDLHTYMDHAVGYVHKGQIGCATILKAAKTPTLVIGITNPTGIMVYATIDYDTRNRSRALGRAKFFATNINMLVRRGTEAHRQRTRLEATSRLVDGKALIAYCSGRTVEDIVNWVQQQIDANRRANGLEETNV